MADPADEECKVIGRFTRYLWNIFKLYHVDGKLQICDIHKAFLDLNLYPSHSQIEEMVHCAIYVNPRLEHHVTFDEFCVLADELLHHYETCSTNSMPHSHISSKSSYSAIEGRRKKKDIKSSWQGGSCGTSSNPTRWRHDEAIPFLKEKEVTFYNPQENNWRPELIEIEERAKQGADLLFFLIDNATRAVVSLCEIAYLVGCHRQIIVIFTDFEEEVTSVNNVSLSEEERIDLSQARKVLVDLIERNGIPVFTNLKQALDCAVLNIRQKIRVQDLTHKHGVQPPKHGHALVGETLIKLRDIFNSFTSNSEDTITQTDLLLSYKCLKGKEMSPEWLENCKPNSNSFTFDEYCRIISEHKRQEMPKVFCQSCVPFLFKLRKFFSDACTPQRIQPKKEEVYDIYLGGSCGDTDWRENIVLPKIRHFGLSYHNPHVTLWYNNMIPMQVAEREKCRLMLYVITGSIPSVAAMVEAAYYIGLGCRVVLCIQNLRPNPSNTGQGFYPCALQDYNRGRAYLSDMASREGVPEFENIEDATECAIQEIQKLSPLH